MRSVYEDLKDKRNQAKRLMERARKLGNPVIEKLEEYKYREYCKEIKKQFRK